MYVLLCVYVQLKIFVAVPCFPGSYNPKKRINACVPCPINTYMEQPGARDCLQCETDKRTEAVGADNIKKCVDKEIRSEHPHFLHWYYRLLCITWAIIIAIWWVFYSLLYVTWWERLLLAVFTGSLYTLRMLRSHGLLTCQALLVVCGVTTVRWALFAVPAIQLEIHKCQAFRVT